MVKKFDSMSITLESKSKAYNILDSIHNIAISQHKTDNIEIAKLSNALINILRTTANPTIDKKYKDKIAVAKLEYIPDFENVTFFFIMSNTKDELHKERMEVSRDGKHYTAELLIGDKSNIKLDIVLVYNGKEYIIKTEHIDD
jgi:hypothetical protein